MPYPGGKGGAGVYQTIINGMPRHEVYVEPFLGGGAVMAAKRPACLNIGVDLDAEVIAQARVRIVGNDDTRSALAGDATDSPGEAMRDCTVGNDIIAGAIVSDGGNGRYEMTDQQHETLLRILLRLPCLVCVSGYWSELYAETLSAWRSCSFQAQTRRGVVTEWLWCNYPVPTVLHDYRYLGKDFRERERIKRMTARWVNRLQAMPILQRQALQAALAQVDNGTGLYRQGWR